MKLGYVEYKYLKLNRKKKLALIDFAEDLKRELKLEEEVLALKDGVNMGDIKKSLYKRKHRNLTLARKKNRDFLRKYILI